MKSSKSKKSSLASFLIRPIKILIKSPLLLTFIFSLYVPLAIIMLIVALQKTVPIINLTKDPLSIAGQPFYYGLISNLGILFWCAAAAICFFTAFILNRVQVSQTFSKFLFCSGLFTTLLMVDDLLMLHEEALPKMLGIPERLCIAMYGVFAIWYLLSFRRTILKSTWLLLALSLSWLAFSILVDSASVFKRILGEDIEYLVEDGAKLLGIATWLIYYSYTCWQVLNQHLSIKSALPVKKIPVSLD